MDRNLKLRVKKTEKRKKRAKKIHRTNRITSCAARKGIAERRLEKKLRGGK